MKTKYFLVGLLVGLAILCSCVKPEAVTVIFQGKIVLLEFVPVPDKTDWWWNVTLENTQLEQRTFNSYHSPKRGWDLSKEYRFVVEHYGLFNSPVFEEVKNEI